MLSARSLRKTMRTLSEYSMEFTQRLIQGYYYSTLPYRKWNRSRAEGAGRAPIVMLFYHRVADIHENPWSISCQSFERQMDSLQRHCEVISLAEAQSRIVAGRNDRLAACVTFDDGYADNCDFAIPLLLDRGLPFTYFVSLSFVVRQEPFPHDVANGQPLAPNTMDQILDLSKRGVDIGAHTRTHIDLGGVDPADEDLIFDEVVASRNELADQIECDVPYFAFPYGQHRHLNDRVFSIARENGIQGVCSAYGGYNYTTDDGFHFQRLHADPMFWRTVNWLTVDPRLHNVDRYTPAELGV